MHRSSSSRHPLLDALRAHRERHRGRHPVLRSLAVVFGVLFLLTGAAMLVLPGPGLLVTVVGLGLLALEFEWAERWLQRAIARSQKLRSLLSRSKLLLVVFALVDTLVLAAILVAIFVLHWNLMPF